MTDTVPTRYWHRARRRARAVRRLPAPLQAGRGPARALLRARARRTTRSCSRPTAARPASASTRSRRSRSIISCPARRCCRSAPPAATSPASSARTGTSRNRARSTRWPTAATPGGDRARRAGEPAAARSPSPTTIPSSSWNTRSTSRRPATRVGVKTVAVTAGYISPEPRAEFFRAHGRRQRRPQGLHRGLLPQALHRAASAPCSTRSNTSSTRPSAGSRSRRCSFRARTTRERELHALSEWVREHLGPDVPLHFTAFHPDYKMLDKPRTPHADADPRAHDRAREAGSSTSMSATSTISAAPAPIAPAAASG